MIEGLMGVISIPYDLFGEEVRVDSIEPSYNRPSRLAWC